MQNMITKRKAMPVITHTLFFTLTLLSIPIHATTDEGNVSNNNTKKHEETTIMLPGDVPLVLVRIPAGQFMMGSEPEERHFGCEGPQHEVTISRDFYLGRYEVTQRQWIAVMNTTPWSGRWGVLDHLDSPAVYITWNETQQFIAVLNVYLRNSASESLLVRLPTEAEWEYACRAGTTTAFYWGPGLNHNSAGKYTWYEGSAELTGEWYAHVVGLKLPNAFGLYDISGNVWEWCQDWYGPYPKEPMVDPIGPDSGSYRVLRGGSWLRSDCWFCGRSSQRNYYHPHYRSLTYGFRLAASPKQAG
jgi:formylglycine-generating enzyme required for sulfatase activity